MKLWIVTTGGTFDKVYFDAKSAFTIGAPMAGPLLDEAGVTLDYTVEAVMARDSLEMTQADRADLRTRINALPVGPVIVIHGTDTMTDTAEALVGLNRTVVLTGALQPARMRSSDAAFNLGFAVAAVQLLTPGVYIAMQGQVFSAGDCRKDRDTGRFHGLR